MSELRASIMRILTAVSDRETAADLLVDLVSARAAEAAALATSKADERRRATWAAQKRAQRLGGSKLAHLSADVRGQRVLDQSPEEDLNKNTDTLSADVRGHSEYSAAFCAFWKAYPKKADKDAGYRAWLKAAKRAGGQEALLADVLAALAWQVPLWARSERKYTKHPATYLNAGGWKDERPTDGSQLRSVRVGHVRASTDPYPSGEQDL